MYRLILPFSLVLVFLQACDSQPSSHQTNAQDSTQTATKHEKAISLFEKGEGQNTRFEMTAWQKEWSDADQVAVQLTTPVASLHPGQRSNETVAEIFSYVHAFLIQPNIKNLTYEPQVLASMPELDETGTVYRCEVRADAKFDDGSPLTANDVEFTIKVALCKHVTNLDVKDIAKNLKEFKRIDDQHFEFHFNEIDIQTITSLSQVPVLQASVYDPNQVLTQYSALQLRDETTENPFTDVKEWAQQYQTQFGATPETVSGAGPYQLKEFNEQKIVLEKKTNHWLAEGGPAKIIFKVSADAGARILELKNQEVDVARAFSSSQMRSLAEDPLISSNYNMTHVPSYTTIMMVPNLQPNDDRYPIFKDVNVRKAFAHALAVQDVVDKISNGKAVHLASFVSILKAELHRGLKPMAYDLDKVDSLLALAGWEDSDNDGIKDRMMDGKKIDLRVEIKSKQGGLWQAVGGILAEGLKRAGFDAQMNYVDNPTFGASLYKTKDFDAVFLQIGSTFGPDYALALFDKEEYPAGMNLAGYLNDQADSLAAYINLSLDANDRKKALMELQEIVYNDQPYFFLLTGQRGMLVHKRFGSTTVYSPLPNLLFNEFTVMEH